MQNEVNLEKLAKTLIPFSSLSQEDSLMFQVTINRESLVAEIQKRLSES